MANELRASDLFDASSVSSTQCSGWKAAMLEAGLEVQDAMVSVQLSTLSGVTADVMLRTSSTLLEFEVLAKEKLQLTPHDVVFLHEDQRIPDGAPDLEAAGIVDGAAITVLLQSEYSFVGMLIVNETLGGYKWAPVLADDFQQTSFVTLDKGCCVARPLLPGHTDTVMFTCSTSCRVGVHANPLELARMRKPEIGGSKEGICLAGTVIVHGGCTIDAPAAAVSPAPGDVVLLSLDHAAGTLTWSVLGSRPGCPARFSQKLPQGLRGKALYPCIAVDRRATIEVGLQES